jgi:hypothetical protein
MKITAPAKALDAAMSLAVMAADKQLDTPIRIVADHGTVRFCVTNPRAAIAITATAAATVLEAGEAAMSAMRLAALLSGFAPRAAITMTMNMKAAMITCGTSQYRLPLLPDPPGGLVIDPEIGRADLATADCLRLLVVVAAAGTERTRFYLNGVFMHNVGGRLVAVSTDGAKMLRMSVPADYVLSTDNRLIVPTPVVTMLTRLLRQGKPGSGSAAAVPRRVLGDRTGLRDHLRHDRCGVPELQGGAAAAQRQFGIMSARRDGRGISTTQGHRRRRHPAGHADVGRWRAYPDFPRARTRRRHRCGRGPDLR